MRQDEPGRLDEMEGPREEDLFIEEKGGGAASLFDDVMRSDAPVPSEDGLFQDDLFINGGDKDKTEEEPLLLDQEVSSVSGRSPGLSV